MTSNGWPKMETTAVSFLSPASKGADTEGRQKVYLHPGHVYVGLNPTAISCMLGSCVAVCLWDVHLKIGGAVHYLLPGDPGVSSQSSGVEGIKGLISQLRVAGSRPWDNIAKVFGGACVLEELRSNHIGMRNIETARAYLDFEHIPIAEENVGGKQGRKVMFFTDTGETRLKLI